MSDRYYTCRWVMRPVKPRDAFFKLYKAAEELKIDIKVHGVQADEDGFRFIQIVAHTPSRNVLQRLIDHIGGKIGLNTWRESQASEFETGEEFTVQAAKDLGDAAEVYGKANEKRKKKMERKEE